MFDISLELLVKQLRELKAWQHKNEITILSDLVLEQLPIIEGHSVQLGDDAAAIKIDDTYLLLAAEAVNPSLLKENPYLAGRASILANVNDIYAMGGEPLAVVDTIISPDIKVASEIIQGIKDGCNRYNVPIVGGHITATGHTPAVTASILGRAKHILSSFNAKPDDILLHVTNMKGSFHPNFPFWNCSSHLSGEELRRDLSILPLIAENEWCDSARDISMAGIFGSIMMLIELSGVGAQIDLNMIPQPKNTSDRYFDWLISFPSYGFVLSVRPWHESDVKFEFEKYGITCCSIGQVNTSNRLALSRKNEEVVLWDFDKESFTGFSPSLDLPFQNVQKEQLIV